MKKNDAIIDTVKVILWGIPIGYLHQESNGMIGFQYDKDFLESRIQISPICMPLSATTYIFPTRLAFRLEAQTDYHIQPSNVDVRNIATLVHLNITIILG